MWMGCTRLDSEWVISSPVSALGAFGCGTLTLLEDSYLRGFVWVTASPADGGSCASCNTSPLVRSVSDTKKNKPKLS